MAQFTNQAQLSYGCRKVVLSNVAVGQIVDLPIVGKMSLNDDYSPLERITFVLSVINPSCNDITNIRITDDLGAYEFGDGLLYPLDYIRGTARAFIDGEPTAIPAISQDGELFIGGFTLGAGSNLILLYEAEVNRFAPLESGSQIINRAEVTGDGITVPVTAQTVINAAFGPRLSVTKSISPMPVLPDGELTYTFVIENSGSGGAGALENAVLTDTFDPIIDISSVTLDGVSLIGGIGYRYNSTAGEFATASSVITVPAATYEVDSETGSVRVIPGTATLVVKGTIVTAP